MHCFISRLSVTYKPWGSLKYSSRVRTSSRIFALAAMSTSSASGVSEDSNLPRVKMRYDNITKSSQDQRLYRGLELNNGLKVLLISDSTTDKSAASLTVNTGYLNDPDYLPGLAHFCEHMLFLGTKKYPLENGYSKFLTEHGGSSNASTSNYFTTYFFDIQPDYLPGALDRFSQFFLDPLFAESATEREVNSVNSEHEKNLQSDSWRIDQLERSTAKEGHSFSKFGTGTIETLDILPKSQGINVREELLAFHDKWYSANLMTLAVLGKEDLDELEKMVVPLFEKVENKNVEVVISTDPPFGKEQLGVIGYIVPIKDLRSLSITFPIPDVHEHYKSAPDQYLSHLIGHEGPGSLLAVLRSRGLCSSLVGGVRGTTRGFDFFGINVDLTEEGIEHVDDIISLVFQYIEMLKSVGPLKWIFEEYRDLHAMHFRFKDKQAPRGYVNSLSGKMQDYPMEDVITGRYLISEWKPKLIEELLKYLSPDNIRVGVVGKKFSNITDKKEKWYGTDYKIQKLEPEVVKKWSEVKPCEELKLPDRNDFIPTNFEIFPREENNNPHPIILHENELSRVWYKQDDEFLLPKVNISFEFISPLAYLDPHYCNMTYMFVMLFKDSLNEYVYSAELAGLKWELTNTKYGMVLGIGGYNDKLQVLLDKVMEKLTDFKINPKRFEILKENYVRGLHNFESDQPYQHAVYYLAVLLSEQAWTKKELLDATDQLTVESVQEFIPQLLSRIHVESLVHGNTTKTIAMNMFNSVMDRLKGSVGL